MIFNEVTRRLFDNAVKKLQESVDNIQTTSRATLSSAGWYRVAEYASTAASMKGSQGNACTLVIKKSSGATTVCYHKIALQSMAKSQKFVIEESYSDNPSPFTKIRYTYENTSAFLEVYYAENASNNCAFAISNTKDYHFNWQAITPTLTSETVDGVTVTTTYDIPANASPVTDLDIAEAMVQVDGTTILTTSILDKAVELADGFYSYRLGGSSYTGNDLPATEYKYSSAEIYKRGANSIVVVLYPNANGAARKIQYNIYESSWLGWNVLTTTADLANYFKNTGGTVSGDITQTKSDGQAVSYRLKNGVRDIEFYLDNKGRFRVVDNTNGKNILINHASGATTVNADVNGTASGNLALDGGGTVKKSNGVPIVIEGDSMAYLESRANGVTLGYLGFDTDKKPKFMDRDSNAYELLHSGNYSSYALPLTGGTLNGLVNFNRADQNFSVVGFTAKSALLGYLGMSGKDTPVFMDSSGTGNVLHHDGNSAKVVVSETALTAEGSVRVW